MSLLEQASLVMIPSGYKEDVVYCPKPTDGSGDLTFTRASDGTRVNSSGYVENVPWNLLQYSEQFDNGVWTKTLGTITANATTAPDGTLTADLFTKTSAVNTVSEISSSTNVYTTTGVHTLSVYIKTNVGNSVLLRLDNAGNTANFRFNFTTKTFTNTGANVISSSFDELPNDWFRLKVTGNVTSTSWSLSPLNLYFNQTSDSFYVWGAQLNQGSTAKPYFPTTDRQNVPRLTYEGGCPSLLLEPQRTNLVTYSEQLDNAAWTNVNSSETANATTSPQGLENATKVIATGTGAHYIQSDLITYNSSTTYTFSVFAKKSNTSLIQLLAPSGSFGTDVFASYNFDTLEVTSGSSATASMEDYGNGWYRLILTGATTSSSFASSFYIVFTNNKSIRLPSFASSGEEVYCWGAQLEAGSYATSYIPTTSAAVTRVADECYKTGISSLIGQSEGTLFFECTNKSLVNQARYFLLSDGGFNNRIDIFQFSENNLGLYVATSGVAQVSATNITLPSSGSFKFAVAYANNDYAWYLNGTQIGTDTSASVPTLTNALFALNAAGGTSGGSGNSPFKQAALFKTRLTNDQLAALTTL